MVKIERQGDNVVFTVLGLHKLWAFKSNLTIPFDHITNVHADLSSLNGWKGFRMPGTYIPFVISAGTFRHSGSKDFWDVTDAKKALIVELKDEEYDKLFIEVEDTEAAIELLTAK